MDPSTRTDVRLLATLTLVGVGVFAAIVVALHLLEPEIDPVSRTVSEYVLGRWGWLLGFAAIGLGLAMLTTAAAMVAVPRPRTGLVALAVAGVLMLVVAANPTEAIDPTNPVFVTPEGNIHVAAGLLAFTAMAVAAPLLTPHLPGRLPSVLRWAPPAGYAVFWLTALLDAPLGAVVGASSATGIGERFMALTYLVWLTAAALALRAAGQPAGNNRTRMPPTR